MTVIIPSEHEEQVAVVQWCKLNKIFAVAVANGFHTNGKKDGRFFGMMKSLEKEGYSKGFPDLVIIVPNGGVMFLEMKRLKGSKTSPEQAKWNDDLTESGHHSVVCKGFDEAIEAIKGFM